MTAIPVTAAEQAGGWELPQKIMDLANGSDEIYGNGVSIKDNRPILRYDWNAAKAKYNKKIGYIDADNLKHYLEGESESKYENM